MEFSSTGFVPSMVRSVALIVFSFDAEFRRPSPYFKRTIKRFVILSVLAVVLPLHVCYQHFGFLLDSIFYRGYANVQVRNPVFVVSNARSGSTFLQRLLYSHPNTFTSISVWEIVFAQSVTYRRIFQLLSKLDQFVLLGIVGKFLTWLDHKIARYSQLNLPHPFSPFSPDEDEWAMASVGCCQLLGLLFPLLDSRTPITRLADFDKQLSENEQKTVLEAYRKMIQRHMYFETHFRNKSSDLRYLAKNPTFTLRLNSLLDAFPDASIVAVVRDPRQAVPSMVSYICGFWHFFASPKVQFPFSDELQTMCTAHYTYPKQVEKERPEAKFVFVRYERVRVSPIEAMRKALKDLNVSTSDRFELPKNFSSLAYYHQHSIGVTLGVSKSDFEKRHAGAFEAYPEYQVNST